MKKIIILLLFILSNAIFSQDYQDFTLNPKEVEPAKYLSKINQRLFLNRSKSFEQAFNYLDKNEIHFPTGAQSSSWLIDSYTYQRWNSSAWQNDSSHVYAFSPDNLLSERRIRDWVGAQWVDQSRLLYNYDQLQRKVSQIFQMYLSDSWVNSSKKIYDYNSQGLLSTETTYRWNNADWENWQLITSTYYNNNEPLQDVYRSWENNSWVNSERTVYEYFSNSIIINFDLWLFETWINLLRIVANYDTNGLLNEIKIQIWIPFVGWTNLTRTLFTFDINYNIIEGLNQQWDFDFSDWVDYSRITSTYTPENLLRTNLEELWSANSYWINYFFTTYDYDAYLNHIETIGQTWNGSGWSNSEREVFGYFEVTSVEGAMSYANDFKLIGNYPNPFNPTTTIQFYIPELSKVTLIIYNSIGEEVAELLNDELSSGTHYIKWNAEGFNSGVYFYQLSTNGIVETKKMILLK